MGANRPLMFVVAESDIEVLQHLEKNHTKKNKFFVYSTTLASTVPLSDLLLKKFNSCAIGSPSSTVDILDSILNKNFHQANNSFESYIFLDSDNYISDKQIVRKIKDILSRYQLDSSFAVSLICISHTVSVPPSLERLSEVVFFDLPDENALRATSDGLTKELELKVDKDFPENSTAPSEEVVINLKGLTKFEVEQAYLQSYFMHKKIELPFIRNFKKSAIAKTDLLSLLETEITFDSIGGLATLKKWIKKSAGGWTVEGRKFGLPLLKGLLMVGLPGCGKAQPLGATVFTPTGPRTMGEIQKGDVVCTPNGKRATVVETFPQGKVDVYLVYFEDGSSTECCGDHLWQVTLRDRRHQADKWIVPIKYLLDKVKSKEGVGNIYVETAIKVDFDSNPLPMDPYILGLLIGDGSFGNEADLKNPRHLDLCSADAEISEKAAKYFSEDSQGEYVAKKHGKYDHSIRRSKRSPKPNKYQDILKGLGLWGKTSVNKFIPIEYLYSSHKDRMKLLQGLMDTDGDISSNGMNPELATSSPRLAQDFKLLVESLGGLCTITSRIPHYKGKNGEKKPGARAYRCWIKANFNPFSLKRKENRIVGRTKYSKLHRIVERIEYVGKKEAKCIAIDDRYNLYLTDGYIVTHNSLICKAIGNEWGLPIIQFDPARVFSSRVGDSESNIRRVLQIVENISPCILFIDEIEKGLAGMHSSTFSDAGVTARVIGSFLIWLQECTKPVFTVATSNNIQYLPPELIQRFDETFFVNLPQFNERKDIFSIHLKKLNRNPDKFLPEQLAQHSEHFCGREIEQALKEAMYDAFNSGQELSTEIILAVLSKKTNLLTTMAEQLNYLLKWVGWDDEKQDGIRARFANPVEGETLVDVQSQIDKMLKDIEGLNPNEPK
jgi:hypothetical protein